MDYSINIETDKIISFRNIMNATIPGVSLKKSHNFNHGEVPASSFFREYLILFILNLIFYCQVSI